MTVVNRRLEPIFDEFCKDHCKHRIKKKCIRTGNAAVLLLCPVGVWWDLNDYLNEIKDILSKIQDSISPSTSSSSS